MLEYPPQLNITQSELNPIVADYFDTLLVQRDAILNRYNLIPETAEEFCNLRSTDEDREAMLALYERMVHVIEQKQIPSSEVVVLERMKEQQRINDFFGENAHIEVPPLPSTITPERIEQWKEKRFELRYLPSLTLKKDDDYPGWKKKPIQNVNLFRNLSRIQLVPQNQTNPHLAHLAPNQLAGCWTLIDTRSKPNYQDKGEQTYEDDQDIQTIIKQLAENNIFNAIGKDGRRNLIHPLIFNDPSFWEPFYDYLDISQEEAVIRLPRVIEQSIFGQGEDWDGTDSFEWAEEYYGVGQRLVVGNATFGGVSYVGWDSRVHQNIGFRCVVVFSSL